MYISLKLTDYYCFPADRKVFLTTWKDIPASSEVQGTVGDINLTADQVEAKLNASNIFTIARRSVGNQELLYTSAKLVNNIWLLMEFKVTGASPIAVRILNELRAPSEP